MAVKSRAVPLYLLVFFTRQLAVMLTCGIPLVQALDALTCQPEHKGLESIIIEISRKVAGGHALSQALRYFPETFSPVFVTMVKVGEETGSLESSFHRLSVWLEKDDRIRRRARASLTYPVFVLALCLFLSVVILNTVLPTFCTIFREMGTPLPWITILVMGLTDLAQNPLAWVILAGVGWMLARGYRRLVSKPAGAAQVFDWLIRVPVIGDILLHGTMARYCSAAGPLVSTGMNLTRALRLSAQASGNPRLALDANRLEKAVSEGIFPADYMAQHPHIYSNTLVHMLAAGEEASTYGDMFQRAGEFHQLEMESAVDLLGAALEPVMLVGVSIAVAILILAIFLPLYGSLSQLG